MVQPTRKRARCQCDPECKEKPLKGLPFCEKHARFCPRKAPLSGFEPAYEPHKYNRHKGIRESHNCYAYGLDWIDLPVSTDCTKESCPIGYPQPGRASGYPKWSKVKGKRCPDLTARIMGEVPGVTFSTFTARCPKGTRKIAPVIDENEDYHFYRQDKDGWWSHKPGSTKVTRRDATRRRIYDPLLASRQYSKSGLHYKQFCGYMCVPATQKHKLKRGGSLTRSKRVSIRCSSSSGRTHRRSK